MEVLHRVVLQLALAKRGSVSSNDDQLGLAAAKRLEADRGISFSDADRCQ